MKVVVAEPGKKPEVVEIKGDLSSMQALVGGYIECVGMEDKIDLWVNEEGLLLEMPFNRCVNGHYLHGTIFAASHDGEGNTVGLNERQIKKVMSYL